MTHHGRPHPGPAEGGPGTSWGAEQGFASVTRASSPWTQGTSAVPSQPERGRDSFRALVVCGSVRKIGDSIFGDAYKPIMTILTTMNDFLTTVEHVFTYYEYRDSFRYELQIENVIDPDTQELLHGKCCVLENQYDKQNPAYTHRIFLRDYSYGPPLYYALVLQKELRKQPLIAGYTVSLKIPELFHERISCAPFAPKEPRTLPFKEELLFRVAQRHAFNEHPPLASQTES